MSFRIQTHGRLQEWVAEEKGYFTDEGLDYEFVDNSLMNTLSRPSALEATEGRSGAFETMEAGNSCQVGSACHWAVNMAAAASHGRMWGNAYSVTPSGIYVAPGSPVRTGRDLAKVEIGVGYHSGSHFSALSALLQILDEGDIEFAYSGGPQDRLAAMLDGSLAAANVFGSPLSVLEQKGFRKIVDTTFMIGFLLEEDAATSDVEKYFRALQRAQRDIDAEPWRYTHYFLRELPEDYHSQVDVSSFGTGERIVFEPYTREVFESTQRWMEAHELFPEGQRGEIGYEGAVLT